jgi:hypothetical protein
MYVYLDSGAKSMPTQGNRAIGSRPDLVGTQSTPPTGHTNPLVIAFMAVRTLGYPIVFYTRTSALQD